MPKRGFRPYDRSHAPRGSFVLNKSSPQAHGLIAWYVFDHSVGQLRNLVDNDYEDLVPNALETDDWIHGTDGKGGIQLDGGTDENFTFTTTKGWAQSVEDAGGEKNIWSIMADFTFASTGARKYIAADWDSGGSNQSLQLEVLANSSLRFGANNGGGGPTVDSATLAVDTRYHAIGALDDIFGKTGPGVTLYMNGTEVGFASAAGDNVAGNTRAIGTDGANSSGGFDGQIFEIRLYKKWIGPGLAHHMFQNRWDLFQPVARRPTWRVPAAAAGAISDYRFRQRYLG